MEPTARAREIAPLVAAAIEHIEAALNLGSASTQPRARAFSPPAWPNMPRSRWSGGSPRPFARHAASATLRLTPLTGIDAAEQLDRGAIDVAIAHLGSVPPHIKSILLLRDPFASSSPDAAIRLPGKTCRSKTTPAAGVAGQGAVRHSGTAGLPSSCARVRPVQCHAASIAYRHSGVEGARTGRGPRRRPRRTRAGPEGAPGADRQGRAGCFAGYNPDDSRPASAMRRRPLSAGSFSAISIPPARSRSAAYLC